MCQPVFILASDMVSIDLNILFSTLTPQQKSQPDIRHAIDVQSAIAANNYHQFFDLFLKAPNMGGYILDHMIERERVSALVIMTKAYVSLSSPFCSDLTSDYDRYMKLPLSFIASELAFEDDIDAVLEFLKQNGADFIISNGGAVVGPKVLECKLAHPVLVECLGTKHSRFGIKGSI